MFKNMRMGVKLVIAFLVMFGITVAIGYVGYSGMRDMKADLDEVGKVRLPSVESLGVINEAQTAVTVGERGIANFGWSNEIRKVNFEYIEAAWKRADEAWNIYAPLPQTQEEAEVWKIFVPLWEKWKKDSDVLVDLVTRRDQLVAAGKTDADPEIVAMIEEIKKSQIESRASFLAAEEQLGKLLEINSSVAADSVKKSEATYASSSKIMLASIVIAAILTLSLGIFFVSNIGGIISDLLLEIKRLIEAAVAGKLDARGNLEKINFEFQPIIKGFNDTLDAVIGPLNVAAEYIDRIGKGDIPQKITDSYQGDFNEIKNNINNCINSVNGLIGEAGMLSRAAVEGRLATRGNPDKFEGAWASIVQGFNDTLDAVIGPLNVAAEYVDRISKGDIPKPITDSYNGDFNEFKNNLNACIEAINGLITEMNRMSREHDAGDIDVRIPDEKFSGAYSIMAKGVNDMVFGHIAVKKKAMGCVAEFSRGNFDAPLEKFPGKKSFINDNIELLRANVKALIGEAAMLTRAAVQGKLATRGNAAKFQGAYAEIVTGVNDTLDAVIGPLNVSAEYIDRISKGDMPPQITDSYNGDFNEIKNNLNRCIDALNGLIGEAGMLSQAAVQGKLATRGNPAKFQGAYAEIVQGVNDTLDAVIGPLNVAAEYVDRISKGDIPKPITDSYNGDFNEFKNNLNACIEALNGLIAEMNRMSREHDAGDIDVRIPDEKFSGAYGIMAKGVNDMVFGHIAVKKKAMGCVAEFAKGNFEAPLEKFPGKKAFINDNIELLRSNIKSFLAETSRMYEEQKAGDIEYYIREDKFDGAYRQMVVGYNEVVRLHVNNILAVLDIVGAYSDGNFEPVLKKLPGKQVIANEKMDTLRKNLMNLIEEASALVKAAVEGRLMTRADAVKFSGDFRKIVQGMNDTLDAVIKPVNEASEVLKELAACNFAARVEGNYSGDHALIKNNLNEGMEAVQVAIRDTGSIVNKFASGDLTVKAIESNYKGDIVGLARDLNASIEGLRNVIVRIRGAASSVASAADEISAASDQITRGAQSQASAADETSASMEQMSVNIMSVAKNAEGLATNVDETTSSIQQMGTTAESVAKNAESMAANVSETSSTIEEMVVTIDKTAKNVVQADNISRQASDEAKAGGEAVLKTVDGMRRISEMMSNISGVIQSLGQRSEAIGNIVEVIEEIADQTNLLALNAAIEAARAGEAGRGFAVVADEVRKLAERSVKATKEIGEVIKKVQQETAAAVRVTEEGARNSKEGIELADKAGAAISRIMEAVNGTSQIMQEISRATNEQSNAAKNVIRAVEEMNRLTQSVTQATKEQASGSKQVVKASEAMSMMTEQVKNATAEQKKGGDNVVKAVENISGIAKSNLTAVEQLSRSARDMAKQSESLQELVQDFNIA